MTRLPRLTGLSILAVSLVLLAVTGCGESYGTVSGDVTFNGKPVRKGNITFHSQERKSGRKQGFAAIEDGKYSIPQVPVGEVVVTVDITPEPTPPPDPKAKKPIPKKKPKGKEKEEPKVPAKYADVKLSPLKYTITKGEQTLNIELQP